MNGLAVEADRQIVSAQEDGVQGTQEAIDLVIRIVTDAADDAIDLLSDPCQRGPISFGDLSCPILR